MTTCATIFCRSHCDPAVELRGAIGFTTMEFQPMGIVVIFS